jgi:nitrate/nitrite-specific signal transduction histidine kinase
MQVKDDGCGFDLQTGLAKEKHLGLKSMQERAELAKGRLTVNSSPGRGTVVQFTYLEAAPAVPSRAKETPAISYLTSVLGKTSLS